MNLKKITQIKKLSGKKIFLRVDFNVKIAPDGGVHQNEDFRIRRSLPTIEYLVDKGAIVILVSHLGRPAGKIDEKLKLNPIAKRLSTLLGRRVDKLDECIGSKVEDKLSRLLPGQIVLLGNVRFYPGEDANDLKFARQLANLADIYVNDAFAFSHRKTASMVGITKYLPSYAGFLVISEVETLSKIISKPEKPLVALLGGAKIITRLGVIEALAKKVDYLMIGGGLANNFLKAQGHEIGKSLQQPDYIKDAKKLLKKYSKKIKLPIDVTIDNSRTRTKEAQQKDLSDVKKSDIIIDIGTRTVLEWSNYIKQSKTIFMSGPLGIIEDKQSSHATRALVEIVAAKAKRKTFGLIGGGESVWLIYEMGLFEDFDYVSTGGGAMLKFLEGKTLPALKPLIK